MKEKKQSGVCSMNSCNMQWHVWGGQEDGEGGETGAIFLQKQFFVLSDFYRISN